MEKNPVKKTFIFLFLLLAILLLLVGSAVILHKLDQKDESWSSKWSQNVTVKDGVTDPEKITLDFTIKKEGSYYYSYGWLPTGKTQKDLAQVASNDLGFVTALVLFDESDKEVFATAATATLSDTTLELVPGLYHAEYHYLTDLAQYEAFAGKYLCSSYQVSSWAEAVKDTFAGLQKNGTWTMEYSLNVNEAKSYTIGLATGAVLGILVSICLTALLFMLITKDHSLASPQYDERQELERGRGFRYAFFTMLCFLGMLFVFEVTKIIRIADFEFLYGLGLFLGILVYVVYCIWHEAYFALNQKTPTVMMTFLGIGIANLLLAISSYARGELFQSDHFEPAILNVFCTLLFLSVFVTMFLKKLVTDRRNAEIEEADEEEE